MTKINVNQMNEISRMYLKLRVKHIFEPKINVKYCMFAWNLGNSLKNFTKTRFFRLKQMLDILGPY